jgi:hypothetical protein
MYVNSEMLLVLISGSLHAAFHIQTRDCSVTEETTSILIILLSVLIV